MKKILNFLRKNIFLTIISIFIIIGITIILVVFLKFFISGNNEYGNRLTGIEEVSITTKDLKKVETSIEENETVESSLVRIQGKIIYITINYNEETSIDTAKEHANSTLSLFSEEELDFYDIGYFLTNSKDDGFNITGNKKAKKDNISFIKS